MLNLCNTEITDAGVKALAVLKQLDGLDLCFTNATSAGVEKLRETLPKCEISYMPKVMEYRPGTVRGIPGSEK